MAKGHIIYNPFAGDGGGKEDAKLLQMVLSEELEYYDITKITNYAAFLGGMEEEDYLVIVGGDGTLNRFVNSTEGIDFAHEILYFPTGTGNDFAKDLGRHGFENVIPVTQYVKELPVVEVKGRRYRFLNGVGFGLDGYCCQAGDEERKTTGKKINYAAIAVKGLLFQYKPRRASVTVDGSKFTYEKVWIAPTMLGRYYGGGMMAAPWQDRKNQEKTLSLMLFHSAGKLQALCAFPGIFKGKHVEKKRWVTIHTGHRITVEFDRPTPLQIDGETILDVTAYTASASAPEEKNKTRVYV